jgi:hypothetical protein
VGGTSTTGVVMLVGEADAGPDYSLETSGLPAFGPTQEAAVLAKYKSGPVVEAFKAASAPLADPNIQGSPSRIVIVKTNPSTKASAALKKWDATTYASLFDKSYGKLANNTYFSVEAAQSEVLPTTSAFTWINPVGTVAYEMRANGGAGVGGTLGANTTPAAAVAAFDALAGIAASGGAARSTITNSTGTLALAVVAGNNVTITLAGATFVTTPSVGDTVVIPSGSVIDGGGADQNVGAYVVTAATSSVISATKLSDAGKAGAVIGTITAPIAVGAVAVSATAANDMVVYAPITITLEAANPSPGLSKSLEIAELTTGTDLFTRVAYNLGTSAVTWVSKLAGGKLLTGTEYRARLQVARQADGLSDDLTVGGEIGLKISYKGTSASLTINDTTLTTTVVGGTGANLSLALKDFATIADLATYISTQTGYKASAGTAVIGQLPTTALDDGTYSIASSFDAYNGRIKVDGYRFFNKVSDESTLVQVGNPEAQASAGLPAPQTTTFLSGGAKGSTTAAQFQAALKSLEKFQGNFVVPCFSRDATADIADGLTESGSTYTIDAIHALVKTHVEQMSKTKRMKHRQGFLSYRGSFDTSKEKAATMASARLSMSFEDVKVVGADGSLVQAQPYIAAAKAAGGQAAAFYKSIAKKLVDISGALQAAGDWDGEDDTAVEDALLAGLLPIRKRSSGGYEFASDQTTYGKDNNFVYNSIQAVYVADIMALTLKQQLEDEFVGQSIADLSAGVVKTKVEAIMGQFLTLKLIAPSDDAHAGFKNLSVTIQGPAMIITVEVKLAGALYFIQIPVLVSQVTQTA